MGFHGPEFLPTGNLSPRAEGAGKKDACVLHPGWFTGKVPTMLVIWIPAKNDTMLS